MFERFSREARQVVSTAGRYAVASKSPALDTDHLLFAAIAEDRRVAGPLASAGVAETTIVSWASVIEQQKASDATQGPGGSGQIAFTQQAKASLEAAATKAEQHAADVTPPDIVLGLIDVPGNTALQLLTQANADLDALRASLLRGHS